MRQPLRWLALGVVALWGAAMVPAADEKARDSTPATCKGYGTSVRFDPTPSEAAKRAKQEEKLVFVLHISGIFEDPNLT
jgi:hypothetical protein